ncbi:methyl-accepting chemotaxis protein [Halalkalibacter wakoensis JCM 9140]|uniref:Methyl-accepting chemotaxis protein n=1 Tax=Halalkalibacter wakoensis JCM 9140 TaxID=1236970 RepID=W4Q0X9_9BACI|nr:HAMP domain-containing methyl-accepting chemotaxis protein [Halalkalibacter wakoensis]GAE25595.1 methyl-accepting chemotaxis protein [Halalkalibacter wakoensis JCM 9140]
MRIRNKLFLGFGLVLLTALGAFLIAYTALQDVAKQYRHLAEQEIQALHLAQQIQFEDLTLTDSVRGVIIEPNNREERDRYDQYAITIDEHINAVLPLVSSERAEQIFVELDLHNQQLIELEEEMLQLAGTNDERVLEIFNGEYAEVRQIFSSHIEEFKQIQLESIASQIEVDEAMIAQRSIFGIIGLVVALIIGGLIAFFISRQTTKPLTEVVHKLEEISSNEGDLTARISVSSKDEIGQLSIAFNKMLDTIQSILQDVTKVTNDVASSSEELSASAEQNEQATKQITMSIQSIASGSEQQLLSSGDIEHSIMEMRNGLQQIAISSQTVSDSAGITTEVAVQGNRVVQQAVNQMKLIHSTVGEANDRTNDLSDLTQKIGQISNMITNIAEQTNLLALNASIEAARVGEHGKGFAVVANEVRKLAEESKKSAAQITEIIHQVLINTNLVSNVIKKGESEVNSGIILVNEAGTAFEEILQSVKEVTKQIQDVSMASGDMSSGVGQVAVAVENLSDISKQSTASSQNVAASSEEQLASIEEITMSAENLSKMADLLQGTVGKFKIHEKSKGN